MLNFEQSEHVGYAISCIQATHPILYLMFRTKLWPPSDQVEFLTKFDMTPTEF